MTDLHPTVPERLFLAIRAGNNIEVAALIAGALDINIPGPDGILPLTAAILYNNPEALDLLLGVGADPNLMDGTGRLPLYHAVGQGRLGMTVQLLTHGARPVIIREGLQTLMNAAGHLQGALKERIADSPAIRETLDFTDDFGVTPLMGMVERGSLLAVEQMLDMDADIAAADRDLNTALHRAARGYSPEMARLLLERGARLDAENVEGKTPLDIAHEPGRVPAVRAVFDSFAITNADDN